MNRRAYAITQAAVIAAAYVILTLPFAQFAFGPVQFRLAETLTTLAALTPAAVPGLFLGCLLTNLMYPSGLGIIDVIFGSLATLAAAWLTWQLQQRLPQPPAMKLWLRRVLVLLPAAVVNALVIGFYLPFLLPDITVAPLVTISFMFSIFISELVVIYLIGLPLMMAIDKSGLLKQGRFF